MLCLFSTAVWADTSQIEALKNSHRFGVGFSAGGPLAVLGVEADVNIDENLSIGLGVGTGLNYSTFMAKARYFLLGEWVSPYVALSAARWWTDGTSASTVGPAILTEKFLPPGYDLRQGFSMFLLAPAVGVQFMHPMGFAVSVELQYLFKLMDLANGTYASVAAHWYF
ncbi:hypothetical protein K2X33_14105 [bacterium]|nr:hypothetical protein [bacterium]